MAVKADWHEASPAVEGPDDPFASASSLAIAQAPLTLDLGLDALRDKLVSLFNRERFLSDRMGLTCPIKDRCDTTCIACPLNEAHNPDSAKGRLCKVGVEQDQAETLLAVKLEHDL